MTRVETAVALMRMAIALLDGAREYHAAALLQHAIDVAAGEKIARAPE